MNFIKPIFLVISIFIVVLSLMRGIPFLWAYIQTHSLPIVREPSIFARDFDPQKEKPDALQVSGLEGRIIYSPYFPYKILETEQIIDIENSVENYGACQERYLNIDKYWSIFWVEIAKCNEYTTFYGPYRFP